jgi:hypothetical protein
MACPTATSAQAHAILAVDFAHVDTVFLRRASFKIFQTVEAATEWPSPTNSPWIRL